METNEHSNQPGREDVNPTPSDELAATTGATAAATTNIADTVTGSTASTATATDTTLSEKPQLATFLEWSYSFGSPFDPGFLNELNQAVRRINELKTYPQNLGEKMGVTWLLDYVGSLLATERERISQVHAEYQAIRGQVELNYGEGEVLEWLHQNRPDVYARVAGANTNNDLSAKDSGEATQSTPLQTPHD